MFGIGGFELFIILVFGFLIFGPDKLPEIAKTIGKAIARFRSAQEEMNGVIKSTDIFDPNDPEQPFKDPVEALDKLAKHQEEKKSGKKSQANGQSRATAAAAPASAPAVSGEAKQESFTERKARYERERAARKAAEAKAAEEAKKAAEATEAEDAVAPVVASDNRPAGDSVSPVAEKAEGGEA